jgi:hypothetical protein
MRLTREQIEKLVKSRPRTSWVQLSCLHGFGVEEVRSFFMVGSQFVRPQSATSFECTVPHYAHPRVATIAALLGERISAGEIVR